MHKTIISIAIAATLAFAGTASAQTTTTDTQRNVEQQQRIENGLKTGQLNTHEAAKLENGEAKVDHMEAHAAKDGTVTSTEAARIQKAQNQQSAAISKQKHDAQTGRPASASSLRMQSDVQHNVNQQARVNAGVANASLGTAEAGKLERGQAHVDHKEALAGANGHVGATEQGNVRRAENNQSARIYHKKHNAKVAS